MKDFMDKISSYNILNYLIPGAIFWFLYPITCGENLPDCAFVEELFVYYFVGMMIYGIGSVVVEPAFKKMKIVKFTNVNDYYKASINDAKIEILSESNNTYRTMIALSLSLFAMKIHVVVKEKFSIPSWASAILLLVAVAVLFTFLYKKRTEYIKSRVEFDITENKLYIDSSR